MNAVALMAQRLSAEAIRRLAALEVSRFDDVEREAADGGRGLDIDEATARVIARWGHDLCGLLNAMNRAELQSLQGTLRVPVGPGPFSGIANDARVHELRVALWDYGAMMERAGTTVSTMIQPRPVVLNSHLVICAPPRGMAPPATWYPRPVPEPAVPCVPADEPETLDELLAAADRAIGVRLGARGRDKGAWGVRAAQLLGVVEHGHDEPDWRGDVEIKTVPVMRDMREGQGNWFVVEDPAIAMATADGGMAKLQRTLWLARASLREDTVEDSTILSWYLLDWDAEVGRLARRYLHTRPKGPKGTTQKGLYLHKRFFADCGMLATLNGVS